MVKTSLSSAGGVGSIPGGGAKIPQASWPKNQNIKQKQYYNKFNKDLKKRKKVHIKKVFKKKSGGWGGNPLIQTSDWAIFGKR